MPLDEVVRSVNRLVEDGYKEVVISGINLGRWGRDLPWSTNQVDITGDIQRRNGQRPTTSDQRRCDPQKPFAVLLFIGPTGVGKTELARALAEFIFGDVNRLKRFDMSELCTRIHIEQRAGQHADQAHDEKSDNPDSQRHRHRAQGNG